MANRLARETSPYLRQHAENPVDWYPWGAEAFERARSEDLPILLSVGYSSCHWCHVMAHESFEDHETAGMMNSRFVNIKVDREERPDIDAIYMDATQAMTGSGGWPMTVFMTPDRKPFFCGTYFPKTAAAGHTTFTQLLGAIDDIWQNRRPELLEQADQLATIVSRQPQSPASSEIPSASALDEATMAMLAAHDSNWGGFGSAPKFPQSMSLEHLLRHHARTGSSSSLQAVTRSLDAMASGGIYDHVGGGFSRYSVDEHWLVPHFEKMLYDNALMAKTYLHAWQVTGEERYLQVCSETIDYVLRDLSHPGGGRYSAEDADSLAELGSGHAEEGQFYVWTPQSVTDALSAAGLGDSITETLAFYGISEAGNFDGSSIPNRLSHRGDLARNPTIEAARVAMFNARAQRPHPGLDDKVLTEWNALMLETLAEAAAATGRSDWLHQAEVTAEFLCSNLRRDHVDGHGPRRWLRSWQGGLNDGTGGARHLAYGSDYAALLVGFVALYEATGKLRWLDESIEVADGLIELFWDNDGAVWTTGDDAEELIARPKDITDNATPSANSMAAVGLLRLEAHSGESRFGEHARSLLRNLGGLATKHPLSFANLLHAIELHDVGITEVTVSGDRPDLLEEVRRGFRPLTVIAWGEPGDGPLWEGRDQTGGNGRAYVCRNQTCGSPADTVEELRAQLA